MKKDSIQPLTALRLFLLALLAGLLIALLLGIAVPRLAMALFIFAQAALRVFVHRNNQKMRNSSLLQMLISVVLGYLIVTS
ncbi:MAG: hypothetical protein ACK41E_02800 [Deinococcales bacterium]